MMRRCIRLMLVAWLGTWLTVVGPWLAERGIEPARAEDQRVIRVAPNGHDGDEGLEASAVCGSAANPCRTIQRAVDLAQDGDVIQVAAGVYTGDGEAVIRLVGRPGVTIRGGYSSTDWSLITDTPASSTVLDGNNSRRVVYIANVVGEIRLENLVIQNGLANQRIGQWGAMGAGLLCLESASVVLRNVVIRNNVVQGPDTATVGGGGAAFLWGGAGRSCSVSMLNVTFENNLARAGDGSPRGGQALGGGLFATHSNVTAENVTFINNRVQAGSGGIGYLGQTWDRADGLGGGAAFQNNAVTLVNVLARQNDALGGYGTRYGGFADGGGLYFERSVANVISGTLRDNAVVGGDSGVEGGVSGGGGLMAMGSTLALERMVVVNNSATGGAGSDAGDAGGGGLYFSAESASYPSRIVGSSLVIAGNRAQAGAGAAPYGGGGGVFSQNTELTLTHATLAGNSVLPTMRAPGIVILNYMGSSMASLRHSIVADHLGSGAAREALFVQDSGSWLSLDYVLFHGNTLDVGSGNAGAIDTGRILRGEPAFASPGAPHYDYHIGFASAALDQALGSSVSNDLDGQQRPYGQAADVGADEAYPPLTGSTKSVQPGAVHLASGAMAYPVTYTIRLVNSSREPVGANLSDGLPTPPQPLDLRLMGVRCSMGQCASSDSGPTTVSWSGEVPPLGEVTISYQVELLAPSEYSGSTSIVNTAYYDYVDSDGMAFQASSLSCTLLINSSTLFVPLMLR